MTLSVSNLAPTTHLLSVQWFTNNTAVPGATSIVYSVTGFALPPGTNLVRVEVTDATSLVRNDPAQTLKDVRTWRVASVFAPPRLSAVRSAGGITISWTPDAYGFVLESTAVVATTPLWTPIRTLGSETDLTLPATNSRSFFRLRKP